MFVLTKRSALVAVTFAASMTMSTGQALAGSSDTGQREKHTFVADGVTITWGESDDMSDIEFASTPGKANYASSAADKKIGTAILRAYQSTGGATRAPSADGATASAQGGPLAAAATDYCTYSPDSYGSANFKPACAAHDKCYSSSSKVSRLTCDKRFKSGLNASCNKAYDNWYDYPDKKACNGVAWTYYQAVRKAGKSHYHGQGSSA